MESGTSRARVDPETDELFTSLRRPLGVTSFGLSQLILRPGQRLRVHRHETQEEVYLVLEGRLTLCFEDREEVLEAGELMRVAPEVRRQVTNRGPDRLVLLAFGGAGEHKSRDGIAYPSWDAAEEEGRPPAEVPHPPDYPDAPDG